MKTHNHLSSHAVSGSSRTTRTGERGYAMAALLVAMSIMAIMMTVVMPVWKQTAQREKEEELVFRGKQYVHAIGLFQRKFANAYPPNIDVLVDQRFLRKKFKDPITNDDFVPIPAGQALPGSADAAGRRARRRPDADSPAQPRSAQASRPIRRSRAGRAARRERRRRSAHRRGRHDRRHQRRDEQEQGSIDSPLQRTRPLQRVGLRLHPAAAGARRRRAPDRRRRDRRSTRPARPADPVPAYPARPARTERPRIGTERTGRARPRHRRHRITDSAGRGVTPVLTAVDTARPVLRIRTPEASLLADAQREFPVQ